jgi:hypothetical protein
MPAEFQKKIMKDLSSADLGILIPIDHETSLVKISIDIVELAQVNGYDINLDAWNPDRKKFLDGSASREMLDDLEVVTDFALQYLEEILPKSYYLEFDEDAGLMLRHAH